jgi:hypothetical protein
LIALLPIEEHAVDDAVERPLRHVIAHHESEEDGNQLVFMVYDFY